MYPSLRHKIAAEKAEREARYSQFKALYQRAWEAGLEAGKAYSPTPMVVQQHSNPLSDTSPVVRSWRVPDGPCGFAGVVINPGTSSFARWLAKHKLADKWYWGGIYIPVMAHGQSLQRKEAHANAMADILKEAGIRCYTTSRMD